MSFVVRAIDAFAPRRLGESFRWLIASAWVSQVGDGIALAAGPLLVASQTDSPTLVAAAVFLQRLPWLILGLYAGVVADRVDRRHLLLIAEGIRLGLVVLLTALILTDRVDITLVLCALFLFGVAETFANTAAPAMMPMLVEHSDLGLANNRTMAGFLVGGQLLGPPIGAALFAVGMAWAFSVQVVFGVLALLLLLQVTLPPRVRIPAASRSLRVDVREGLAWVWHHPPLRTLTLTIVVFNVTWGCAWSVLVLYARDRLGLGAIGFGLITTVTAIGGIAGTMSYGWMERHIGDATLMRIVLSVETVVHLVLAVTTSPVIAMLAFLAFGAEAFVWGTLSRTIRQKSVPEEVQGRVGSVYMIAVMAGLVIGGAIAGPIAQVGGITAPFWFAFAGSAVMLAWIWPRLSQITAQPPSELPRAGRRTADPEM